MRARGHCTAVPRGGPGPGYWPEGGLPPLLVRRRDSRVTAITIPIARTTSPRTCAPNSELPSDTGTMDVSFPAVRPLAATGGVPGAGFGTDEGLIFGNRFAAFPAGLVEVSGACSVGRGPMGSLTPRPLAALR